MVSVPIFIETASEACWWSVHLEAIVSLHLFRGFATS